jgi:hypothetical protein
VPLAVLRHTMSVGGVSVTLVSDVHVSPCGRPSRSTAVMIVTPVQNALMNDRNRSGADAGGTGSVVDAG